MLGSGAARATRKVLYLTAKNAILEKNSFFGGALPTETLRRSEAMVHLWFTSKGHD